MLRPQQKRWFIPADIAVPVSVQAKDKRLRCVLPVDAITTALIVACSLVAPGVLIAPLDGATNRVANEIVKGTIVPSLLTPVTCPTLVLGSNGWE